MKNIKIDNDLFKIIITILIFIISFLFEGLVKNILLLLGYIIISYELYISSFKSILKGEIFDENLLMIIATIGAIVINKYEESVMVILLFEIGEYLSDLAINNSRKKITSLIDLRVEAVNLKTETGLKKVDIKKVKLGDVFVVKPGEKIGLDGVVIEGKSSVDTSSLTGENVPKIVDKNSKVLSGFINKDSSIAIKATSVYETSTATKIINMIENSNDKKTDTEKFITKFSKIYTPTIVFIALLIAVIPTFLGKDFKTYLYRALIFLVTSCPCALVISIPLGYFCGIGRLSREKILAKGSIELDKLSAIKVVALDKTGTITEGVFEIIDINSYNIEKDELLEIAAYSEYYSIHPIAKSILSKYNKKIDEQKIKNFKEISGNGVTLMYQNSKIIMGNSKLLDKNNIKYKKINKSGTIVYIARDNIYLGYIIISDKIKQTSLNIVSLLNSINIKNIVMLSGDKLENVKDVCKKLNIENYYASLLPNQKVEKIKELKSEGLVAFIGDGINDIPVLKVCDLSISMGINGSDAAREVSDVILMQDDLDKIVDAIKISRFTKKIIKSNICFSIIIKLLILVLGILGCTTIYLAVFADVGVTIIAILNTLRIMIKKIN